jgi:hypothetical protein
MDANLVYAIASLSITLGLCGTATINIPIAMATAERYSLRLVDSTTFEVI